MTTARAALMSGPDATPAPAAARAPGGRHGSAAATLGLSLMVVIWAVNFSFIKLALRELPPLAFNALRFPLASLALFALVRALGPVPMPRARDQLRLLALGVLGNSIYQLFFISGMEYAHAGVASLLLSGTPVMTALLAAAVGHERVGPRVWAAVVATFGGMTLVVVGGRGVHAGGVPLWANLLMLGSSACWAVYTVGSAELVARYGPVAFTAWTLWWGSVGIALAGLPQLVATPLASVSGATWWAVAYSGVLSIGVAYSLWYFGVQHVGSTRTAVFNNLVPVVALAVAWAWLHEVPTPVQLGGAAIIVTGVSLARRSS